MKKNKLIGIAVAALGVFVSFGTAFALYQKAAEPVEFGISAGTYTGATGTVTYKINGAANPTVQPRYTIQGGEGEGTALNGTYNQLTYDFTLGATFSEELPAQSFVMGNVSVGLTNVASSLYGKVTVFAHMEGYTAGKAGEATYSGAIINNVLIEDGDTECAGSYNVSVASAGVQKLVVYVKFDMEHLDTLTMDEAGSLFNLSVSWGQVSNDFGQAFIVGNGTTWAEDDAFSMAMNIEADNYEWIFNGLLGTMGEAKCKCGSNYSEASGNKLLDAEKVYDVYWSGANGVDAIWTPRS